MDPEPRPEKKTRDQELSAGAGPYSMRIESPSWHKEVLRDRVEAVNSGEETFIDWEVAKDLFRQMRE